VVTEDGMTALNDAVTLAFETIDGAARSSTTCVFSSRWATRPSSRLTENTAA
jgi:hypothetical protein